MPDVIKRGQFFLSEEKVRIPDLDDLFEVEEEGLDGGEGLPPPEEEMPQPADETETEDAAPVIVAEPPAQATVSEEELNRIRRDAFDEAYREQYPKARQEAYKNAYNEVLPQAKEAAEQAAYADARQEAYYHALNQKKTEIAGQLQEVNRNIAQMQKLQEEYFESYAGQLRLLAVEVAEKLIMGKLQEDDLLLRQLVISTVDRVKNASWMRVEVSERLMTLVDALKKDLASLERAEVAPGAYSDGTVRVATEAGTIDASISTQIDNLRRVFEAG